MEKYGYARISTRYQSLDQQRTALRAIGIQDAFIETDTYSGKSRNRPGLARILQEVQQGDELHVVKLDRLGRTAEDLHDIAKELEERGVALVIGGVKHDPTTPMGKMMFGMLALFAEFERDMIVERTAARLAQLREEGKQLGRKKATTEDQERIIAKLLADNYSYREIRQATGLSNGTINRIANAVRDEISAEVDPSIVREARKRASDREKQLAKLSRDFKKSAS